MELHASNDQTFGPRASIEPFLAPRHEETERLVWHDQLVYRENNKWGMRSRIERTDGSIVVRDGDASEFCWASKAIWFSRPAFETVALVPRPWRKFQSLPITFDLSQLAPVTEAAPTLHRLLGASDLGKNGFVCGTWEGWSVLFPAMMLLSAMTAPNLPIFNVLTSPVGAGVKLDVAASTSDCLLLVRTFGFALTPYRPRAYECLAFWLENSKRRLSLQRTYRSIVQGKPLVLPNAPARLEMLADGYTDGERLVVQRLGANQDDRVWPRSWRHLVIRDLDGHDRIACTSRSSSLALSQAVRHFGKPEKLSSDSIAS